MGEKNQQPEWETGAPGPEDRLESWKEIAAYLKRDIRTLRRWENNEGLPVHRHVHNKLPTVYAYKSELDAWWNNRRPRLEQQEQEEKAGRRRWVWAAAAAAVFVAGVVVGVWWMRQPALPFEERDWVLIASFENRTGEERFEGTLEHALAWELANSRYVNVAPRERVGDTLRLMRKPIDTRVDAALGREVALRDGGIRALITGRIQKLDAAFQLDAALVDPNSGAVVATFREEAEGEKEVPPAVRRLSGLVRKALGEKLALIRESDQKLARVTTPSLRALQLFTEGDLLKQNNNRPAAEQLFRQAIAEDPEFATAYMWLAWAIAGQGRPKEDFISFAEKAVELGEHVSERERLFNQASYSIFAGEDEKAFAMMEALLELHPDDFWATLAMTWLPQRLNRPEVARRYTIKLADMRPNDFRANYDAADAYLEQGDEERARPYIERAIKLPKQDSISEVDAWRAAELDFFPVYSKWFRGDTDGAYAEVQQLVATADSQPVAFRHAFARHLADAHLAFGELKAAESACSLISELDWQHYCLCTPAFERGDREAYRTHRRRAPPAPKSWATIRLAYLRLPAETRAELKVAEGRRFVPGWVESARAILLLHEGHKQAAADLEEAARQLRSSNTSNALYATEALAAFHEENGDLTNAIRVLEEAESEVSRSRKLTRGAGIALLRVRARLAALYRKTGRVKEAEEIERDLRKRLKYADADHPLVVQLNAVQETTVARSR